MKDKKFKNPRPSDNPEGSPKPQKKFVYKDGLSILTHFPGPICKKSWHVFRSMIRKRNSATYRKDIPVPLCGYDGEEANKRTRVKNREGVEIIVEPVNQIWRKMMDGPRPKRRIKNVRMPEPKVTGKKR